jgi:hypothetical protein
LGIEALSIHGTGAARLTTASDSPARRNRRLVGRRRRLEERA